MICIKTGRPTQPEICAKCKRKCEKAGRIKSLDDQIWEELN